jgi:hypothetical protein
MSDDGHKIASREEVKAMLREEVAAGDKQSAATLRAMEIADGERRPPASADGGAGQVDPWADRTPFGEKMNTTIRDALAQKRYGERRTQNHRLESW